MKYQIPGKAIKITPQCVKNHGIENRVDYAFSLLRDEIIKSLKGRPKDTIKVCFFVEVKE